MYHFFVEKKNISDKQIIIEGKDHNHIKNVLRMREGEEISVGTGEDDDEYRCLIERFEDERVICKLMFVKRADVELESKVYLYQCLPKADKMELVIQKCVELGVSEVIPVASKRCVVKLDDKKAQNKTDRWQAIAEAAGKQSKRAIVPFIGHVMSFKDALKDASKADIKLIPYELYDSLDESKKVFENIKPGKDIAFIIGPEGGFEEDEVKAAMEEGFVPVSLGKRILRTETASLTLMAWIAFCLEMRS